MNYSVVNKDELQNSGSTSEFEGNVCQPFRAITITLLTGNVRRKEGLSVEHTLYNDGEEKR